MWYDPVIRLQPSRLPALVILQRMLLTDFIYCRHVVGKNDIRIKFSPFPVVKTYIAERNKIYLGPTESWTLEFFEKQFLLGSPN